MKKISEKIQKILKNLPKTPWVYQMKDSKNNVIYVGKSVNLYSRVHSYFQDDKKLTLAKKKMVAQIDDIEIILCQTEVEALTLETNLIKHLSPKYNILMKDDKNLSYVKITNSIIPEVIRTRSKINDGWRYFGPFTSGTNINQTLKNLRRIFKIRDCKMKFSNNSGKIEITDKAGRWIPCMDYYIGICPAPCLLQSQKIAEHNENISKIADFFSGNTTAIIRDLTEKMQNFAKNLEFEKAQKIKEELDSIAMLSQKQIARDSLPGDHDICVLLEKYNQFFIGFTQIRDGKIIWVFNFEIEARGEEKSTILSQFLARQYLEEKNFFPENIILENDDFDEILKNFFIEKNIKISCPKIWPKKEILDFTKNQIREYAYKKELATLENSTFTKSHMQNILAKLGYNYPQKWAIIFECYDISHTHGHFTYGSRVVINNGKTDNSNYKKYKIKTLEKWEIDDFASHKEVMFRRTLEGIEFDNFADLIIIDGGKWQLSSAISGIKEAIFEYQNRNKDQNLDENFSQKIFSKIQICSIAKREEEIFLPNEKNPIILEKWTPELMLIQKARDESHRFSITANRSSRDKSMKKNILEELPWIGPATRKKLLKFAGSIDEIKNFDEEELLKIINKKQLETLKDHWII